MQILYLYIQIRSTIQFASTFNYHFRDEVLARTHCLEHTAPLSSEYY